MQESLQYVAKLMTAHDSLALAVIEVEELLLRNFPLLFFAKLVQFIEVCRQNL